jgi:hypothetical protein
MNEDKADTQPTLVEKWIQDQQEWQKMAMEYFDSMVNNDDFLVHLGNAMRGSLLAGKPYPGTEPAETIDEAAVKDDRIDEILHALHMLQGEVADLKMTLAELSAQPTTPPTDAAATKTDAVAAKLASAPTPVEHPAPTDPTPGTPDRA